jgi:hypothetical protein
MLADPSTRRLTAYARRVGSDLLSNMRSYSPAPRNRAAYGERSPAS